jgi:hypothetical protein
MNLLKSQTTNTMEVMVYAQHTANFIHPLVVYRQYVCDAKISYKNNLLVNLAEISDYRSFSTAFFVQYFEDKMKMIDPNNQSDSFTSRILGFYVTSHIWVRVKIDTQSYD